LGHASLEVTQRYAHHDDERARDAVTVFSIMQEPKLKLVK
jgi:integrase